MLFVNSESNCVKKNVQLKHKEERRAIPSNVCLISSLRMAVCSCGTHGNQINQPQEQVRNVRQFVAHLMLEIQCSPAILQKRLTLPGMKSRSHRCISHLLNAGKIANKNTVSLSQPPTNSLASHASPPSTASLRHISKALML